MGKTALAQYRARKAKRPTRRPQPHRPYTIPFDMIPSQRHTRIVAALIHGVAPIMIARDQKVSVWMVKRIAFLEGLAREVRAC